MGDQINNVLKCKRSCFPKKKSLVPEVIELQKE